jgi:hypothetical protein
MSGNTAERLALASGGTGVKSVIARSSHAQFHCNDAAHEAWAAPRYWGYSLYKLIISREISL